MTRKVILELNKWDDRRYRVECLSGGRWRFSASFITREAAIAGAEKVLRKNNNVNVRIIDTKEES